MKAMIFILVMGTLMNFAKADTMQTATSEFTDTILTTDAIERSIIKDASNIELIEFKDCMKDAETNNVGDTACINETFGDVY